MLTQKFSFQKMMLRHREGLFGLACLDALVDPVFGCADQLIPSFFLTGEADIIRDAVHTLFARDIAREYHRDFSHPKSGFRSRLYVPYDPISTIVDIGRDIKHCKVLLISWAPLRLFLWPVQKKRILAHEPNVFHSYEFLNGATRMPFNRDPIMSRLEDLQTGTK